MIIESIGNTGDDAVPVAILVGDYNVGKSHLLNALLGDNVLFVSREESRIPPILITRAHMPEPQYAAWKIEHSEVETKSYPQFLGIRQIGDLPCPYDALAVLLPDTPFSRLWFVDTPGGSTETHETALWPAAPPQTHSLFVLAVNIEYWPARHTMQLIAEHQERFAGHFIVVANMADQLNPDEIRRVRDKATRRMEMAGILHTPPFFAVSARLETGRRNPGDEYRKRIKRDVRELCDAGFDALRVALYEFEARNSGRAAATSFETMFRSEVAGILMSQIKEAVC